MASALALVHCARSRFFKDIMANCVAAGMRQVVVLGAGLDTFSLRNPLPILVSAFSRSTTPATQLWKRERIRAAGFIEPNSLIIAPTDLERESLSLSLTKVGFKLNQPAFFQWLGVVPYLTRKVCGRC
jgi:methyltransferase (TIGR00027 family)